jgi:hypothetical protein
LRNVISFGAIPAADSFVTQEGEVLECPAKCGDSPVHFQTGSLSPSRTAGAHMGESHRVTAGTVHINASDAELVVDVPQ